jgi:hypothetical protein
MRSTEPTDNNRTMVESRMTHAPHSERITALREFGWVEAAAMAGARTPRG